jgi:conjugative relaxase-like TrwC/TraI family protein
MKLSGNIEDIMAYHCREENYYFKQGRDLVDELADKGIKARSEEALSYVLVRGKLCERLGFTDGQKISEIDFENLLAGRNSRGDKIARAHKCHGIDLTFSAPKSVSIAGLVLHDGTQRAVMYAHQKSVEDTMREIEKRAYGRLTSNTKDHTGKMVWAEVQDGYSRERDPHLHTHCVVMNLTEVGDKVVALDGREIMKRDFNQLFGALYRQRLSERLYKDHGYEIDYAKNGEWRLRKVPRELEEKFSKRRQQILDAESEGLRGIDAWRKTRKDKDNKADKAAVLASWQKTLAEFNHARKTKPADRQDGAAWRRDWSQKAVYSVEAEQERGGDRENASNKKKWQLALRRATQNEATTTKETLLHQFVCEQMRDEKWNSTTCERVVVELDEQVKQGNIIEVDGHYTSWEMARSEREYISFADDKSETVISAPREKIIDWEKEQARKLSPIQKEAVAGILSSRERLVVVQGDAGAGKTTTLKAVADIYKNEGFEVIGLCMQGVAAQKLKQETGVAAFTLKSFFSRNPRSFRESSGQRVLIFDEASMLDSRNAAKLFRSAKENGDKIILVGDRNQLESIAAGRAFERLCEIKERKGLLIEMNENFRQRDERLREAVVEARKGRMKKSLDILDKRGDIIEISNRFIGGKNSAAERRSIIAKQYGKDTLIITGTQQARDELNLLIRTSLKSDGNLKKEKSFDLARTNREGIDEPLKMNIAEGELIVFTKNEYKNYDVRNGERATVVKLHTLKPHTITVRTEDGRAIDIDTKKYKNIDYGYALTTYKSQGQTYDKVIVDADTSGAPALNDMRAQYVNITRARDSVKIYTDDKSDLKDLARRLEHKRDTLGRTDITLEQAIEKEGTLEAGLKASYQSERELTNDESETKSAGRGRGRGFVRRI